MIEPDSLQSLRDYFRRNGSFERTARIAVALTWPQLKNAEYEVVMRLCRAAQNIGSTIIVTDNDGYPLWTSSGEEIDASARVSGSDTDFAISLHFESPKLADLYTYYAVWQPVDFYRTFGYEQSMLKILSYDDALSCAAESCDAHIQNLLFESRDQSARTLPFLFHSPPKPYLRPSITSQSSLFYVGINWERVNAKRGRFHELLQLLDKQGIVDIYGPRLLFGIRPWEGFACYRGEIPFDGRSVVQAVNRSGICLALSSDPHKESGVMSNRLFEALAGGAVIVANRHPFIEKYFSDLVYVLSDTNDEDALFFELKNVVEQIRRDPDDANRRALEGQLRLDELFSLEGCLNALINQHPERAQTPVSSSEKSLETTLIIPYSGASVAAIESAVEAIKKQRGITIDLIIACSPRIKSKFSVQPGGAIRKISTMDMATNVGLLAAVKSDSMLSILKGIATASFAIVDIHEEYFTTHFQSLAAALASSPNALMAVSEVIDEEPLLSGERTKRSLRSLKDEFAGSHSYPTSDKGCFAFKRELIDKVSANLLSIVPGSELSYLRTLAEVRGETVQTGRVTFVARKKDGAGPTSGQAELHQLFISDRIRYTGRSTRELAMTQRHLLGSRGEGSMPDESVGPLLPFGSVMPIRKDCAGEKFRAQGFSHPEENFTWIDGIYAELKFSLIAFDRSEDTGNLILVIVMAGRDSEVTGRSQACFVSVNGVRLKYTAISSDVQEVVVELPVFVHADRHITIGLELQHAEQVKNSLGDVIDPRRLGARVHSVSVRAREGGVQTVVLNTIYQMGRRCNGRELVKSGAIIRDEVIEISAMPVKLRMIVDNGEAATHLHLRAKLSDYTSKCPVEMSCIINGKEVRAQLAGTTMSDLRFEIPHVLQGSPAPALIVLEAHYETHTSTIPRPSIVLESIAIETLTQVTLGTLFHTRSSANGLSLLKSGFSHPENEFVWIDGVCAEISFLITSDDCAHSLELFVDVVSRSSSGGIKQRLELTWNGVDLGAAETTEGQGSYRFPVSKGILSAGVVSLKFQLAHAEIVDSGSRDAADPRRLGLALRGLRLERRAGIINRKRPG